MLKNIVAGATQVGITTLEHGNENKRAKRAVEIAIEQDEIIATVARVVTAFSSA